MLQIFLFCLGTAMFFPKINRMITFFIAGPVYHVWLSSVMLFIGWGLNICEFTFGNWCRCFLIAIIPIYFLTRFILNGTETLNMTGE